MRPLPSSGTLAFCGECDLPILKGTNWSMKDYGRNGNKAIHGECPRKGNT